MQRIPILGRISAGLPIYAEQNIEGYTLTDLNHGAEYFALRVSGDSMNAIGINDGYLIIVRRQERVENGEVAVVMVGDEDATVKRFYATDSTVTLMPQSTNPIHQPQIYCNLPGAGLQEKEERYYVSDQKSQWRGQSYKKALYLLHCNHFTNDTPSLPMHDPKIILCCLNHI